MAHSRAVACPTCGGKFFPRSLPFHAKSCAKKSALVELPCPFCDKLFVRTKLEDHKARCKLRTAPTDNVVAKVQSSGPAAAAVQRAPESGLVPCAICLRTFAADRVAKHQKICRGAARRSQQRSVFDARSRRLDEEALQKLQAVSRSEEPAKRSEWRERRDATRAMILEQKRLQAAGQGGVRGEDAGAVRKETPPPARRAKQTPPPKRQPSPASQKSSVVHAAAQVKPERRPSAPERSRRGPEISASSTDPRKSSTVIRSRGVEHPFVSRASAALKNPGEVRSREQAALVMKMEQGPYSFAGVAETPSPAHPGDPVEGNPELELSETPSPGSEARSSHPTEAPEVDAEEGGDGDSSARDAAAWFVAISDHDWKEKLAKRQAMVAARLRNNQLQAQQRRNRQPQVGSNRTKREPPRSDPDETQTRKAPMNKREPPRPDPEAIPTRKSSMLAADRAAPSGGGDGSPRASCKQRFAPEKRAEQKPKPTVRAGGPPSSRSAGVAGANVVKGRRASGATPTSISADPAAKVGSSAETSETLVPRLDATQPEALLSGDAQPAPDSSEEITREVVTVTEVEDREGVKIVHMHHHHHHHHYHEPKAEAASMSSRGNSARLGNDWDTPPVSHRLGSAAREVVDVQPQNSSPGSARPPTTAQARRLFWSPGEADPSRTVADPNCFWQPQQGGRGAHRGALDGDPAVGMRQSRSVTTIVPQPLQGVPLIVSPDTRDDRRECSPVGPLALPFSPHGIPRRAASRSASPVRREDHRSPAAGVPRDPLRVHLNRVSPRQPASRIPKAGVPRAPASTIVRQESPMRQQPIVPSVALGETPPDVVPRALGTPQMYSRSTIAVSSARPPMPPGHVWRQAQTSAVALSPQAAPRPARVRSLTPQRSPDATPRLMTVVSHPRPYWVPNPT
mmetsp:Transcript_72636/g.166629  ORF Transcript_72636/g.166629 Transcript_72636/m.166629 type:complete len:911 (-) Transcript_72636:231-2963(-)